MTRRVAALTLSIPLVLAGCGGGGVYSTNPPGSSEEEQPRTLEAATSSAQEVADRISSNDAGGIWDLHSQTLKQGLSREDFIEVWNTCPAAGIPLETEGVRLEGDSTAVVRIGAGDIQESRTMVYEAGQWVLEPKAWKKWLKKTPAQIVKMQKAEGSC